ncbi:unnamed protein product [Paramecium sonneborni]|uniref:Tetratricopeptide repeat protein n=1 Tax=Paramecium sonneborni TaxID=65129 RepID=A0A8S1LG48_9CILI|nr:unnamed protein product [Paramecium sonneborni]
MNQIRVLQIKYSIDQHDYVELACLNEQCKANRVYCHQCLRNGDHIAHYKDQKSLKELIEFFHEFEKDTESLISKLNMMQIHQALDQVIKYQENKTFLLQEVNQCQDDMIIQLKRSITDLKLEELNYFELNQQEQEKADELYQKDEYEEAIKLLDEALINDPKHISSLYIRAEALSNYYGSRIIMMLLYGQIKLYLLIKSM